MSKRVKITGKSARKIKATGNGQRKIEPERFAKAIGAEPILPVFDGPFDREFVNSTFRMSQLTTLYNGSNGLEKIEVSREEFIRLFIADGFNLEKAEVQAEISEALGSHVKIGSKLVKIKK